MLRRTATRFILTSGILALPLLTACTVQYRHEVEESGTETNWNYDQGRFFRYDGYEMGDTPVAGDLQIAITDYTSEAHPVVLRMVGVVHIADRDYYSDIQKVLDEADLVLYEGVHRGGEEKKVDPATKALWEVISSLMGLAAQTSQIDYDREHFKQCDLITDPAQPGQAGLGLANPEMMGILEQIANFKRQIGDALPLERLEDFVKHTNATQLLQFQDFSMEGLRDLVKQMRGVIEPMRSMNDQMEEFAKALEALEAQLEKFETLIIKDRNEYVMNKLADELKSFAGSGERKTLAIFYGAGHMTDFDQRLADAGWTRGESTWLTAWKMNSRGR